MFNTRLFFVLNIFYMANKTNFNANEHCNVSQIL